MACVDQQGSILALREDRERTRALWSESALHPSFENSPDAIFLMDDAGGLVDCNQAAVALFGYATRDELLSVSLFQLSPSHQPDGHPSLEKANEMMSNALELGSHRLNLQARRSDGSEFVVEVLLSAISLKKTQIIYCVWRDPHRGENKPRERSLRASEEGFAQAFKANPHPMSLATLVEGRIIEVNESFVELSGCQRTDLIGASFESLWEMALPRAELIKQIREQGVVRNVEAKFRTRSGSFRLVLLSALVVEIDGQQCLLSVSNDITERRRAEEEVGLLQAISMEVAVAPDLDSALTVVLRHVCEKTGWILGQAWLPNSDGTAVECSSAWFTSSEGLEEFRLGSENVRLPPGVGLPGRVWLSKRAAWVKDVSVDTNFPRVLLAREAGLKAALALPIISGDDVIAVIEFFMKEPQNEDERLVKLITAVAAQLDLAIERKRAEEQLRHSQAALAHVARVTTMGELAASIAHEVNQPLGAIVGNAEICLSWLGDPEPNLVQIREALQDIASDGHRAGQVIARIRSLVKKHQPEKVPLDLSEVARDVIDLVSLEVQRKQVALYADLGTALPLVAGDRVQLQQVLLNLVMNSIEAMNGIEDRKPELRLKTDRLEGNVLALVSDSGVGIDVKTVEHLFMPFATTKPEGMGMGLTISRSIIEAHRGRLWAEPNKPTGATFKFTLPAIDN